MRFIVTLAGSLLLSLAFSFQAMAADSAALLEVLHNKGIIDDASYSDIKGAGKGQSADKKLLDVLHTKGILDDADYKRLSEQSDREAVATVAAVPQSSPAAAAPSDGSRPFDKAFSAVEEGFAKLGGDTVKLKIGAFLQAGYLNDDSGFSVTSPPTTNFSSTSGNQFFVRRARLFFDGMLANKAGFKVSIEASDTSGKILRDAYFFADYIPYSRVTIGQFKVPFGVEGVEALSTNTTINRSLATNFIHYPTLRDLGVMLSGQYQKKLGALPIGAGYAVALVDGNGMNTTDNNDDKDVSGRVWINPLVPGFTVGGSFYHGETNTLKFDAGNPTNIPPVLPDPTKDKVNDKIKKDWDRWAADVEYRPVYMKGLLLRGEFLWARKYYAKYASVDVISTTDTSKSPLPHFDRQAHSYGWYALAAYKVDGLPGYWRYLNGFEPLARYDFLDEDTSTITALSRQDTRNRVTLGLNYYLNKYTRLMANYEIIHADGGLKTQSLETIDNIGHHLFTTLVQVKF